MTTIARETVKTPDPGRSAIDSLYFRVRDDRYPHLPVPPTGDRVLDEVTQSVLSGRALQAAAG